MGSPNDPHDLPDAGSKPTTPPPAVRRRSTPVRVVATADGQQWVVREVPPSQFDRRGTASLVFVSDHAMRRVRDFPADWFDWPDAELLAVSLRK
jgi:hypothetical protein